MTAPVSMATSPHYVWGGSCEGWRLLDRADLAVIEERMPPGTSEVRHVHTRARQFFYVLEGVLSFEAGSHSSGAVGAGQGLEISPEVEHRVWNGGPASVRFLVISAPSTRNDRHDVDE